MSGKHGQIATGGGKKMSISEGRDSANVLLVEDDPDDVTIIRRVLKRAPIEIDLTIAGNGKEALRLLDGYESVNDENAPSLVILDLNMPIMDGHEFAQAVRRHKHFYALPVIVLTTSTDPDVHARAYRDGANAVIAKVDSLEGMSEIVNAITDFWFQTAKPYRA